MILIIDVGRTHTDFALFKQGKHFTTWHLLTKINYTADKYATALLKVLKQNGLDFTALRGVGISSVVPDMMPVLKNLSLRFLGLSPIVIGEPGIEPGIRLHIQGPETIRSDLVADIVAAKHDYGGNTLIINCGTVTAFMPTDIYGNLCGAVFIPSLRLFTESLSSEVTFLTESPLAPPKRVIGKNTVEAMQSGLLFGYVDMVNGLIHRIFNELGQVLPIVVTGGFASVLIDYMASKVTYDPALTLKGIYYIYERNRYLLEEHKKVS